MRKIKSNVFLYFLLLFSLSLSAQKIAISGTVTDPKGVPLPGVNVIEKGTSNGVTTDFDGNFNLQVAEDAVLRVSYLGFKPQEVPVTSQTSFSISLEEDSAQLDEVVVVGYGTLRKSDLTGSVSTIDAKDVQAAPALNIENAIQGQSPGVFVTATNGAPGSGATIRIRGGNSITAGNEPLYVIDGFIGGGNLNTINTQDIKSIEILKDASATAIYGARGANGVILITTKRGNAGGGFSLDAFTGIQEIPEFIDVLNGQQYAEMVNEAQAINGEAPIYENPAAIGEGTDWQRLIAQTGYVQNVTASFNGGSEKTKAYVSANYYNQTGVIRETGFNRYQLRTNIDQQVTEGFKLGTTTNLSYIKREQEKTGLGQAIRLNPADPIYDENGNYNIEDTFSGVFYSNPEANLDLITAYNTEARILASLFAEWKITDGLTFRPTFSTDVSNARNYSYTPAALPLNIRNNNGGSAYIFQSENISLVTEALFNYSKDINENNRIDVVAGATVQNDNDKSVSTTANDLFTDVTLFDAIQLASPDMVSVNSGSTERDIVSYLGRINYSLLDKYLFTVTGRRDGSSVFGENNKWANFGAVALGWNLAKEKFIDELNIFDTFKLRASLGESGNQGISPYQTLGALNRNTAVFNGTEYVGVSQNRLPNPDLKWERTSQLDIGLEMAFLNRSLRFEVDYYKKTTDDLLYDVQLPYQVGFDSQLQNVGKVENQGLEFALSSTIVNKEDLTVNFSINMSTNKNRVVELAQGLDEVIIRRSPLPELNPLSGLIPGETIGAFLGLDYLGTWSTQEEIDNSGLDPAQIAILEPGDQKYGDFNEDGFINNDDSHVIGDPTPDIFGGFNADVQYKNFSLAVYFQGSYGNDLYSIDYVALGNGDLRSNNYGFLVNRWTPENTDSDIPRVQATRQKFSSTADVHDGSFLRLKTLRLGYDIPMESKTFKNINIYFTGTNLLLWKSDEFLGYDPEVSNQGTSTLQRGFYAADYPQNRSYNLGLRIEL